MQMTKKTITILLLTLTVFVVKAQTAETQSAIRQSTEKIIKSAEQAYIGNNYNGAFDMLRDADHNVAASGASDKEKASLYYETAKLRMQMYLRMRRSRDMYLRR